MPNSFALVLQTGAEEVAVQGPPATIAGCEEVARQAGLEISYRHIAGGHAIARLTDEQGKPLRVVQELTPLAAILKLVPFIKNECLV